MSDQVTNKSAVAQQNQVRAAEMALLASASTSDELLRKIAILLFILVAGLLTVFAYYASSICTTVILAAFLAILFDPRGSSSGETASAAECGSGGHSACRHGPDRAAGPRVLRKSDELRGRPSSLRLEDSANPRANYPEVPKSSAKRRKPYERGASQQKRSRGSLAGYANLAFLSGARSGICLGSADHCRRGSLSNVFHALHQGPHGRPNGRPLQLQGGHGSIHPEP